jgi:hypothetical protein
LLSDWHPSEEKSMLRGILVVLLVVLLVYGGWLLYNRGASNPTYTGEVITHDNHDRDHMDAGAVDIDGRPIESVPTPSRSDEPGMVNGEPAPAVTYAPSHDDGRLQNYAPSQQVPAPGYNPPYHDRIPDRDTFPAFPPDGVRFGGTGRFSWYREGDITWRVDSASGSTCVAFATLEQWRLPLVSRRGCRND